LTEDWALAQRRPNATTMGIAMVATLETLVAGPASRRAFDHVLIIMFENQYRGYVLGNPYMRRLARPGIQFGNCLRMAP